MGFQESFHSIKALVDDFKANEKHYLNPNYGVSVNELMAAKKQLQQCKTDSTKKYINRKCERRDKEIDKLVYQFTRRS